MGKRKTLEFIIQIVMKIYRRPAIMFLLGLIALLFNSCAMDPPAQYTLWLENNSDTPIYVICQYQSYYYKYYESHRFDSFSNLDSEGGERGFFDRIEPGKEGNIQGCHLLYLKDGHFFPDQIIYIYTEEYVLSLGGESAFMSAPAQWDRNYEARYILTGEEIAAVGVNMSYPRDFILVFPPDERYAKMNITWAPDSPYRTQF